MAVTFDGTDLTTLAGVTIDDVSQARPSYTRNKVQIPGKAGSYDFSNNQAEDYDITVSAIVQASDRATLRTRVNALFAALDGKGTLVSDGISVQAQVYGSVVVDENLYGNVARCTITFECDAS